MNEEELMLCGAEPREILQTVIQKKIPAIMCYLSRGKWHFAKVLVTDFGTDSFEIEVCPTEKPLPINIQIEQRIGMSLKYGHGKFIFETTVTGFEPAPNSPSGGAIVLELPDQIKVIPRRSYFRVKVPDSLKVNVELWRRDYPDSDGPAAARHFREGRLVDISAGGLQIVIDSKQGQPFRKGQFIGLRFAPVANEAPLEFSAQIRNILPTADDKNVCLGLQTVGLETSAEGREVLQRLCDVVEQYHRMEQSDVRQQDFQTTGP